MKECDGKYNKSLLESGKSETGYKVAVVADNTGGLESEVIETTHSFTLLVNGTVRTGNHRDIHGHLLIVDFRGHFDQEEQTAKKLGVFVEK